MPAPNYLVQSLARAASILTAFSFDEPELTIGEIAQRSRLPRSTVHRLVVNLVRLGLLTREARTDRYRLGLLLVTLGGVALSRLGLREKARPAMELLAARTEEAVFLAVLDQLWSVYIEQVEGHRSLRMTAAVGRRAPLHCTATGKTLLAYLPEATARHILAESGLSPHTARTITEMEPLFAGLAEIRRRGYAVDNGELEEGLAGFAAPVRNAAGEVVAALTVAGPGSRILTNDRPRPVSSGRVATQGTPHGSPEGGERPELASLVIAAADEISAALGYRPAAHRSAHRSEVEVP